ncbi:MAG: methyltransferase [Alphaproteobacteria bacterium]|nr:methyltransferase [Alphaproteobacteria bacterium]MDA8004367.1 methyltransferase [Alphaproteobacteria bacterium]MDA8005938.1 methyltransferase [Alphaproteobacteria bacterium]MDA8012783.1 methyltransferase [Alphaproteobacteria bacterium]
MTAPTTVTETVTADVRAALRKQLTAARLDASELSAMETWLPAGAGVALLREWTEQRVRGVPLSRICGRRGFWRDDFVVTKDVLAPRPESELLVEEALRILGHSDGDGDGDKNGDDDNGGVGDGDDDGRNDSDSDGDKVCEVVEFGTGCGAILLSVLNDNSRARGVGIEKSAAALNVARENGRRLGLESRVRWLKSDWSDVVLKRRGGRLAIANPPYLTTAEWRGAMPEVRDYEPRAALDGGADGLAAYRTLGAAMARALAEGEHALVELTPLRAAETLAALEAAGFGTRRVLRDLGGRARAACLVRGLASAAGGLL